MQLKNTQNNLRIKGQKPFNEIQSDQAHILYAPPLLDNDRQNKW